MKLLIAAVHESENGPCRTTAKVLNTSALQCRDDPGQPSDRLPLLTRCGRLSSA
jgi:hypothetical protein